MARRRISAGTGRLTEVNLTSVMDLSFLLLITFIITFPLVEQGIHVNLPIATAKDVKADKAQTITVDAQGNTYINDQLVPLPRLPAAVADWAVLNPDTLVLVRADEGIRYGTVVEVLKILRAAKITRLALVTQAEAS